MNLNKIILVSIFLLAMLTLTPLCACENSELNDISSAVENSIISDNTIGYDDFNEDGYFDEDGYSEDDFDEDDYSEDDFDEDDYDMDDYDEEDDYPQIDLKFSVSNHAYVNNPTKITFTGPKGPWGEIDVKIDGKTYTADYDNGKATVSIKSSTTGTKTISYSGDLFDGYASGNFTLTFENKPVVKANDLTMYSTQTKTYKIRLLDANNNALGKKSVTFYLDNKKLKTATTDKNGYASVKLSKLAAYGSDTKYNIKVKYDGVTFTKKLTVKTVFKTFKKANVKNANKLSLQLSTKKVNGKYLKGKVVKIKINGKTYKSKINSKGIVKLSVKKSAFAKCSANKYTYYFADAYLGKDTAWAAIQFSKVKPTLSYKILLRIQGAS